MNNGGRAQTAENNNPQIKEPIWPGGTSLLWTRFLNVLQNVIDHPYLTGYLYLARFPYQSSQKTTILIL